MAFTLSRNVAGRVPDCIDHIPAGTTLEAAIAADKSAVPNGYLVALDEAQGKFEAGAAGAPVSGFTVFSTNGTSYPVTADGDAQGTQTYTPGGSFLVQPIHPTTEVQADIEVLETVAGTLVPGSLIDINSATGLNSNLSTADDFRVLRILKRDAAGKATVVAGQFQSTDLYK